MELLHDKDIREPLFEFLEEVYGKVRILEEKTMGRSRADAVMVTESGLYGIEIKSDADGYARLARQVRDYDLYYDYNYAVVGTSHAAHIEERLPDWWGIITVEAADGKADFYILRKPLPNPEMDWKRKISILWRPELARIQKRNHLPEYKEKSKLFVQGKLLEKIPAHILSAELSQELFERDYTLIGEQIGAFRAQHKKPGGRRKKRMR